MRPRPRSSFRTISTNSDAKIPGCLGRDLLLLAAEWGLRGQRAAPARAGAVQGLRREEQFVEIPQGASSPDIRRRLLDARVVSDDFVLRAALWWSGRSRSLQAGEYALISR